MYIYLVLSIIFCICSVQSFLIQRDLSRSASNTRLFRKFHRTLDELGKSKKQIWRDFRDMWNTAAAQPGFYDDEIPKYELTLYRQSNTDGKQKGDCHMTQFVQLLLEKKNVSYDMKFVNPIDLPKFIRDEHNGSLPVIRHNGKTLSGVMKIVDYLESEFNTTTFSTPGVYSFQDVLNRTENFYPALKNYICNTDDDLDPQLELEFFREIDKIDEMVRSAPGRYICGLDLSLADLYLLPLLFKAHASIEHFKGRPMLHFKNNLERPALEKYLMRMMHDKHFQKSSVFIPLNTIVWGWKIIRGEIKEPYMILRKIKV